VDSSKRVETRSPSTSSNTGSFDVYIHGERKGGLISRNSVGDIVDVVANGSIQKGLPYKYYHGKTGVVYNVTKSGVGVILHKPVGSRYIEKRINVRIEHVKHSRSRDDFLRRVKANAEAKKKAKKDGTKVELKRQPVKPREERTIKLVGNLPETIVPVAYETTI
jgi:large subunit ribosomal protein L21e